MKHSTERENANWKAYDLGKKINIITEAGFAVMKTDLGLYLVGEYDNALGDVAVSTIDYSTFESAIDAAMELVTLEDKGA